MPVYEYECRSCGHAFEEFQRITDRPVHVCPRCRRRSVHRLVSHTSFLLKGSGWYATDYASAGRKSKDGKDREPGVKDEAKKDSKDPKPSATTHT